MPRGLRVSAAIARHWSQKRATSSSRRGPRPKLTRITSPAARASIPIAASTWLGLRLPDEQALPADTAKPAMSKRISCAAAAIPGIR